MYMGMTKEDAIKHIRALYPPDSQFPETAEEGQRIIEEAKCRCNLWENLPEDVLVTAARMMIDKEKQ